MGDGDLVLHPAAYHEDFPPFILSASLSQPGVPQSLLHHHGCRRSFWYCFHPNLNILLYAYFVRLDWLDRWDRRPLPELECLRMVSCKLPRKIFLSLFRFKRHEGLILIISKAVTSIVQDLWIIALPIPSLVKLQLGTRRKIHLILMFSVGLA